jgi:hypothetical protein
MQENVSLNDATVATLLRRSSQPLFRALNGESTEASLAGLLSEVHNILYAIKIISSN